MSNKNSENLFKKRKREEMEKMSRMKRSLDIQGKKNRSIEKGLKGFSHFERRKRMFKSKPPEFDQLVKLPKR